MSTARSPEVCSLLQVLASSKQCSLLASFKQCSLLAGLHCLSRLPLQ